MFNGGKKRFRDENLFFNGLYQVNKIDTKFDNGQFLQTLHCSRFNNQQGEGAVPLLTNASIKSITEIKDSVNIEKKLKDKKSSKIENAKEFAKQNFEGLI